MYEELLYLQTYYEEYARWESTLCVLRKGNRLSCKETIIMDGQNTRRPKIYIIPFLILNKFMTTYETEELRPLIYNGIEYNEYSVSNWGNIYSHKVGRRGSGMVDRNSKKLLPIYKRTGTVNGRGGESRAAISVNGKHINVMIHKAVMNAFRPVDLYPPIPMEDYNICPLSVKEWIRNTVVINHIDHNPHNNRLSNLEYTTPRGNIMKAVEHHGGYLNNKKSL